MEIRDIENTPPLGLFNLVDMLPEGGSVRFLAWDVVECRQLAGMRVDLHQGIPLAGVRPGADDRIFQVEVVDHYHDCALIFHPNGVAELRRFWTNRIGECDADDSVGTARAVRGDRTGFYALTENADGETKLWEWVDSGGGAWDDNDLGPDAEWAEDVLTRTDCNHVFRVGGRRGSQENLLMYERCRYCDETRERPATKEEQEKHRDDWEWLEGDESPESMHYVWHKFEKHMEGLQGIAAINAAYAFAKSHPGSVRIVRCDDSYHANSDIVLVGHEDGRPGREGYWGTSVLYIPQCDGRQPMEFFLYPNHAVGLKNALDEVIWKAEEKGEI